MMATLTAKTAASSPAQIYEQFFVPSIFRIWTGELLKRVKPAPGDRVLDVACGTGIVAREAAPLVGPDGSVTGLDPNPGMLAVARSIAPAGGPAIDWRQGSADALPFPEGSFDLVLCQHGMQFFPDRPAAMAEMRRVLAPGGRIGAVVWRSREHQTLWAAFDDIHERHFGSLGGGEIIYALGDADEFRRLFVDAGFPGVTVESVVRTVRFPSAAEFVRLTVLGGAAVLPEFAQMDDAARNALVEIIGREIAPTLDRYREGEGVAFPLAVHIATASA
jgi:ubiquinone/menaquinone biosynthesis C-methylase UbiE